MYSTCLFCRRQLGRNSVLDFSTGRRLVFDPVKARLWVVCPTCNGWNLSPIEERFEVLETCEKLFRGTPKRVSTDNVGLAHVAPDLELVRIGRALRPEFAAWRYGRTLRARYSQMTGLVATSVVVTGGIGVAGVSQGVFGFDALYLSAYAYSAMVIWSHYSRRIGRVDMGSGTFVDIRRRDLGHIVLRQFAGEPVLELSRGGEALSARGTFAVAAARVILPWANRGGGSTRQVATAVELLEASDSAARWPSQIADGTRLTAVPAEQRLAVEMASNEEIERRAMEGELGLIERAWHDAEEVASIADSLLVPSFIDQWLSRTRQDRAT